MHAWLNEEVSQPVSKDSAKTDTKKGGIWLEYFLKTSEKNPSGPGDLADCIEDMAATIFSWVIGVLRSARKSPGMEGISKLSKMFLIILLFTVL